MVDRVVTKQLGGVEDLVFGLDTVVQARFSGDQTINKINASHIPIVDAAELITATEVDAGLAENRTLINANTADIANNTASITAINAADLANGSFEVADTVVPTLPADWTIVVSAGGSVALETSDVAHGDTALKFVSTGTGGGTAQSNFRFTTPGRAETIEWVMKSDVVDVLNKVDIQWFDKAAALLSTSNIYSDSTANTTTWTTKQGTAVAPANAVFYKLLLTGCDSADVTTGYTIFDGVKDIQVASQTIVDAEVNDKLAVTPKTLASYNPIAITDYFGGIKVFINDEVGNATLISLQVIALNAWATIGPTGSTNVWAILDALPLTAKALIVRVVTSPGGSTSGQNYDHRQYARPVGSSAAILNSNMINAALFTNTSGAAEVGRGSSLALIPVNSANEFQAYHHASGTGVTGGSNLALVGWIE